jgi:hypothetical protein
MAKAKASPLRILCTLVLVALLGYFCYMYINQEIVLSNQRKQIQQMELANAKLEEKRFRSKISLKNRRVRLLY